MVQMITQGIDSGEGWVCFILLENVYIVYKYYYKSFNHIIRKVSNYIYEGVLKKKTKLREETVFGE